METAISPRLQVYEQNTHFWGLNFMYEKTWGSVLFDLPCRSFGDSGADCSFASVGSLIHDATFQAGSVTP